MTFYREATNSDSQGVVPRPAAYQHHISITWEHVRKANSQVHPRPTESKTLEIKPSHPCLNKTSSNSDTH